MKSVTLSIAMLLTIALTGCGSEQQPAKTTATPEVSQDIDSKVEALLSKMTLAEKIGQMTQAERKFATPEDVKKYHLGSILNGGGSVPGNNTVAEWRNMIDDYQKAALQTRLAIPIIYGTDAVHGHNNVVGATLFPHNVGLGAMRDPQLMEAIGKATAKEVAATGVHWNFAPALCVARDKRWGRAYECYGEHPEIGASYSGPYVKGMQESGNVLATAKHWVGDGGATYGTGDHQYIIDRGNTVADDATLNDIHIAPYLGALEQNVGSVMISYSSVNGLKMHEHKQLNTDVLKQQLAYRGFLVSDWQAISEVQGDTNKEKIVSAINSGLDMAMEPEFWKEFIADLTSAVNDNLVSMQRIDDAVRRILTAKFRLALFERPMSVDRMSQFESVLGNSEHRKIARKAVQQSMVLLKNENVLPLKSDAKIFVAGQHANDIGLQSGGWPIEWQGKVGNITPGTTILQGIKEYAENVTYGDSGRSASGHDVAVIVVGEQPYAEGFGDYNQQPCEFCQPLTLTEKQLTLIEEVKATKVPMVVVTVSGRPLLISEHIDSWSALLAAWLPGTEGAGVADVLFGKYAPSGKLPVSWPQDISQIDQNVGDDNFTPLFAYGYGLSY